MKSKTDPRHLKRIKNIQALFAWGCGNAQPKTINSPKVIEKIAEIDKIIQKNAPKWPLDKINKVDLSILRYAFWELIYKKDAPSKVIIDEAVELAKEFGNDASPKFVNGVIGTALKKIDLPDLNHE